MLKKYLPIGLLVATMLASQLSAQQSSNKPTPAAKPVTANAATDGITDRMVELKVASQTVKADPVVLTNQMMLVFMERMKTGNLKEARDIANDPAAERNQRRLAIAFLLEQYVKHFHQAGPVFFLLAIRQDNRYHLFACGFQRTGQHRQIQRGDHRISNDGCALARDMRGNQLGMAEQRLTDFNRVTAFAEFHL